MKNLDCYLRGLNSWCSLYRPLSFQANAITLAQSVWQSEIFHRGVFVNAPTLRPQVAMKGGFRDVVIFSQPWYRSLNIARTMAPFNWLDLRHFPYEWINWYCAQFIVAVCSEHSMVCLLCFGFESIFRFECRRRGWVRACRSRPIPQEGGIAAWVPPQSYWPVTAAITGSILIAAAFSRVDIGVEAGVGAPAIGTCRCFAG